MNNTDINKLRQLIFFNPKDKEQTSIKYIQKVQHALNDIKKLYYQ